MTSETLEFRDIHDQIWKTSKKYSILFFTNNPSYFVCPLEIIDQSKIEDSIIEISKETYSKIKDEVNSSAVEIFTNSKDEISNLLIQIKAQSFLNELTIGDLLNLSEL